MGGTRSWRRDVRRELPDLTSRLSSRCDLTILTSGRQWQEANDVHPVRVDSGIPPDTGPVTADPARHTVSSGTGSATCSATPPPRARAPHRRSGGGGIPCPARESEFDPVLTAAGIPRCGQFDIHPTAWVGSIVQHPAEARVPLHTIGRPTTPRAGRRPTARHPDDHPYPHALSSWPVGTSERLSQTCLRAAARVTAVPALPVRPERATWSAE